MSAPPDEVVVTAAGGRYRLCWCGAATGFRCTVPEDFLVDAGELHLLGPEVRTGASTCVSGQTCLVEDVYGYDLSASDVAEAP